jgi:aspartate 1-decarboxylase
VGGAPPDLARYAGDIMLRTVLRAKIHRATVTDSDLEYVGSLTVDPDLLDASGIAEWELIHVLDINNGQRFETYVILGERGSGQMIVNGAAARLVQKGDIIIVVAYGQIADEEVAAHEPTIVFVDEHNRAV